MIRTLTTVAIITLSAMPCYAAPIRIGDEPIPVPIHATASNWMNVNDNGETKGSLDGCLVTEVCVEDKCERIVIC